MKMRRERYLTDLPSSVSLDVSFLGKLKADHIAIQIALGELNPTTLERYEFQIEALQLQQPTTIEIERSSKANQKKIQKIYNS